jgi:mRNA degradation ribonuclease J1/J2
MKRRLVLIGGSATLALAPHTITNASIRAPKGYELLERQKIGKFESQFFLKRQQDSKNGIVTVLIFLWRPGETKPAGEIGVKSNSVAHAKRVLTLWAMEKDRMENSKRK